MVQHDEVNEPYSLSEVMKLFTLSWLVDQINGTDIIELFWCFGYPTACDSRTTLLDGV